MITRQANQTTEQRNQMRGGNGVVELTALLSALPPNARLFSRIRLVPGASIGEHVHEKESELFYFLSGSGVVTDDGERVPVAAGDSMATLDGHSHSVENTGSEDLVILAAIIHS